MSATALEVRPAVLVQGEMLPEREQIIEPGGGAGRGRKPSLEVQLASEQLSSLASLHHLSDYSHIKFGTSGASCIYIPMSIHVPDHVERLKVVQASRINQRAWWLSSNKPTLVSRPPPRLKEPIITRAPSSAELMDDLQAALTSSLSLDTKPATSTTMYTQPQLRTSETHPINISTMIPPELLHMISLNIHRSDQDLPVIFDVPISCQLHRLLFRSRDSHARSTFDTLPLPDPRHSTVILPSSIPRTVTAPSKSSNFVNLLWTQSFLRKSAATSTFSNGKGFGYSRHSFSIPNSVSAAEPKLTPERHALDLALHEDGLIVSDDALKCSLTGDSTVHTAQVPFNHKALEGNIALQPEGRLPVHPINPVIPSFSLGNLFLSSCPGKKVRLSGPVKGRGAVCRDLAQDLRRMSEMGVRCIVCCLDDTELEFLGAPWHEYARIADELGLDVLRIPIPEGLVPLDVEAFDAHLARLIDTYTLTGRHILVHCRGGVGRAGLIACCWAVKLGLCGWVQTESHAGTATPDPKQLMTPVRRDTLHLVQRVLTVVRKQRSPKAIETFEQVKFLVDYVEYLRNPARASVYCN